VTKRSLDEARQFGRSLQPTHDLQAEAGAADGQSTFAILDVNEVQADAQPKKITLQGVANVVAPLLPPASIAAAGSNTQIQFNDGGYLGGDAGLTFNKTTDALTAGSFIPSSSAVPTNGVYLPSANNVAISSSGVQRLLIDASGNVNIDSNTLYVDATNNRVGLGISSPGQTLHVSSSTTYQGILVNGNAAPAVCFDSSALTAVKWKVGLSGNNGTSFAISAGASNDDKLHITSTGNVGIGVTDPGSYSSAAANLVVGSTTANSGISIRSGATGVADRVGSIYFADGTSGNEAYRGYIEYYHANDSLGIGTAGSPAVTIDSSRRLLVGTASDSGGALLQVNGNRIRIATAKTPASATDTGVAGEICWDANYIYVCTATNTWKRTAISTWP
jgi:hypothetical protein